MNMDPTGQNQGNAASGRGRFHWWIILAFLVYAGYYYGSMYLAKH